MHAAGGFTNFNLVECPNDIFNITENVPPLVVEDTTAALIVLADTKDILDAAKPVVPNVEEIRTRKFIPLGAQLSRLNIGRDLTPHKF